MSIHAKLSKSYSSCLDLPTFADLAIPIDVLSCYESPTKGMSADMDSQPTKVLPTELVTYGIQFIEAARRAETVRKVFEAACTTVRNIVPDCCVHLWMVDDDWDRICRAHFDRPGKDKHFTYPLYIPDDSDIARILFRNREKWEEENAGWLKQDHLEGVGCPASQGLAFMRMTTFDGLRLLATACVPSSLRGNFHFHKEYFQLLGQALVQAIERIRLKNERALFAEIARLTFENETRRSFFDRVAKAIAAAFDSQGCSIFIYDKCRNLLVLGGTTGLYDPKTSKLLTDDQLADLAYKQGEGLTGWIFENKKLVRLFDANDEREWEKIDPTHPIQPIFKSAEKPITKHEPRPFLGAPIFRDTTGKNGFVGVIRLHGKNSAACFLPSDERRLTDVSIEVARSIYHWDSAIVTQESLQGQEALLDEVMPLLKNELGLQAALETIAQQAKRLFQGCAASVLLKRKGKEALAVTVDLADQRELDGEIVVPFDKGLCGYAAVHKETVAVADVTKDARFYDLSDLQPGALSDVKSAACAPIVYGESLLGVLNVDSNRENSFHPDDRQKLQLLERLASQAAFIIQRERDREIRLGLAVPAKALLHQFTNDLSAISGLVDVLNSQATGHDTPPVTEDVRQLKELAGRLSRYWDELYKKPVFDRAHLQPFYLNDVVERADWLLNSLLEAKSIQKRTDFDSKLTMATGRAKSYRVKVDLLQFYLILSNLVANAVEASNTGDTIVIASKCRTRTREAVLTVQDFGTGIDKKNQVRIFKEPFTTTNGKGNGLLLVAQMVKVQGGKIECKSKLGQGSSFTIRFPISQE